jgi:hypothetical protein
VRIFTYSQLEYTNQRKEAGSEFTYSDIKLHFRSNQPLWAGTSIYLRLAGFSATVTEIPVEGPLKSNFFLGKADFDLAANELHIRVQKTIYTTE